jgi:hypothetical protein
LKGNAEIAAIARVPRSEDEDEDGEVIDADNNGDELSNDGMNVDEQDADLTDEPNDNE